MPNDRVLSLVLAVAFSSTVLCAQDQTASSGETHKIVVETDSGRYGVGAEKLGPKRLGVEIYPGATVDKSENASSDASLSIEWGKKAQRLYLQVYVTSDSADKVLAFYRKQLSKYGPVTECRDGKPLAGAVQSQLRCDSDDKDDKSSELKAGTRKKEHMIGVTPTVGGTRFEVVYLDSTPENKR
jgi:hypothetical protein